MIDIPVQEKRSLITIRNLVKSFDGRVVLKNINLEIYKGETLVLMGGSGSGKSTLLRIMTGGITPDSGEVHYAGKEMGSMSRDEKDQVKRRFGMSFQHSALLDFLTVEENVCLPLIEHTKLDAKIICIIARMKLNLVGL